MVGNRSQGPSAWKGKGFTQRCGHQEARIAGILRVCLPRWDTDRLGCGLWVVFFRAMRIGLGVRPVLSSCPPPAPQLLHNVPLRVQDTGVSGELVRRDPEASSQGHCVTSGRVFETPVP